MLNIVIFGAPGSGKGTQSERIVEKYGLNHISTGEVLRAEIAAGTELGKTAQGIKKMIARPLRCFRHRHSTSPSRTTSTVSMP